MSEIMIGEGFTDCRSNSNERKTAFLIIPHYLFQSTVGRTLCIMKDRYKDLFEYFLEDKRKQINT